MNAAVVEGSEEYRGQEPSKGCQDMRGYQEGRRDVMTAIFPSRC